MAEVADVTDSFNAGPPKRNPQSHQGTPILIYGLQHHNVTENAAKTAQQQSPGLQQESTCSNVAAVVTERKKQKILLTLEGFRSAETSSKIFSTPLPTLK